MKKFISLLLVCLMVVPFGMLAGVSVSAAETVVYLGDAGDDANDGTTAAKAVKTITKAYEILGTNGGTIAVTGTFTQSADFVAPSHTGKITLKGADSSAVYSVPGKRYQSGGPLEITDLKINQTAANFMLVACYNELTVSSTVVLERGTLASFIVAGGQGGNSAKDRDYTVKSTTLTINGGNWSECIGSIRSSLNSPSGAHTAAEFKDYTLTINVGGTATVAKIAAFSRSFGGCDVLTTNASCVINLNGGKITGWVGTTDAAATTAATVGYDKGVTINIGKDFDITQCFTLDADKQVDNVVTDASGNKIFYGFNGDNVFVAHSSKELSNPIGKTKVVIASELYDALKNSNRFRGVTIEKATATPPSGGSTTNKIDLPAEPTLTSDTKVYIGYNGKGTKDGSNADNYKHTQGWSTGGSLHNSVANGGTFIVVGKGYFGATATFSATGTPVYITGKDGATDYTGTANNTADANGNGIPDGQGTQTGMFMIANRAIMTIAGEVIFNDITIIDRSKSDENASLGYNPYTTFNVTGKLVIGDNVDVIVSENDVEFSKYTPVITVAETGYVYLHSLGFSDYTGTGVIVIGDEILDDITEEMFANFDGKLVDEDGYEIDFDADDDQGGNNPDTSDKTWALAVVAAIAVMGCAVVVASKKRA